MSIKKRGKINKRTVVFTLSAAVFIAVVLGLKIFLNLVYVPAILMYHSVGDPPTATLDGYGDKLNVTPEVFEKQMRFLKEHNYNVIPLNKMVERIREKERIPHKTVTITFDDGLKNNFTNAYPVLKKYGLPATFFVAVDFIGKKNFLTWEDIREMQENGISIGSHTMSHRWLTSLDKKELKKELVESKAVIERVTGKKVYTLSYPLGRYNEETKKAAKEAGYIGAVATNPGPTKPKDDIYALKRVRISMSSASMIVLWIETSGYYTFIKEVRDDD
ncbi:MAG: polysaccharide deacetylase family protein [Candidatus Omnitrophica bacterium]|nr:polysaccharide deacetylase family protein [Candidatus Omnitrophota bacterium]